MTYPCIRCNMDEGSPVCRQEQRCRNMPTMDATLRAAARRNATIIRPEPDCRNCSHYTTTKLRQVCGICTNADRYDTLPPVRLWRYNVGGEA